MTAGGRRARIGLALAHRQLRARRIEARRRIGQRRAARVFHVVEDEFLAREAGDVSDTVGTRETSFGRRRPACRPASRSTRWCSRGSSGSRCRHPRLDEVVAARSIVEIGERELAAAIHHVIEEDAVAVGRNGRTQDFDVATASTRPCALRGARSMSTITALCGSPGETAMVARAMMRS